MQYRSAIPDDIETIRDLLIEVGWEKHVREYQDFKKMVENSDRTVVALDGSRIVGFARALCDEVANGYITMVAVAEDKRQDGVGASIVNALMGDNLNIKWVITSDKNSIGFWEKQGFRLFKRAMMRPRLEPDGSYPKNTPPNKSRNVKGIYQENSKENSIIDIFRFFDGLRRLKERGLSCPSRY